MNRFTRDSVNWSEFFQKFFKRCLFIFGVFKRINGGPISNSVLRIIEMLEGCFIGFKFSLKGTCQLWQKM